MRCPKCRNNKTGVVDSRPRREGTTVTRRRKCPRCNHKFTTTEVQMVSFTKQALIEDRVHRRVETLQQGLIHDLNMITGEVRETA